MLVIVIIAIVVAIVVGGACESKYIGKDHMWRGQRVRVLARDTNTTPATYIVRTETGEAHVSREELTPITEVERQ